MCWVSSSKVGTALVDMSITYASMFSNEPEDSSQENSAAGAADMDTRGGHQAENERFFERIILNPLMKSDLDLWVQFFHNHLVAFAFL